MGIDSESDVSATLVVGPTTNGMVRVYIEADGVDLPMDFEPDEALEIAEELRAAAERAREAGGKGGGGKGGGDFAGGKRARQRRDDRRSR